LSWIWITLAAVVAFVLLVIALRVLERGGDAAEDGQEDRREEGDEP
jgi:beta-lactamase regulating signal transducer with metallopeptidase domain